MVDRVKPGDPHWGVYEELARWCKCVECIPEWDEILEVEYVRQRGDLNMLDGRLTRYCYDNGLYHATNWLVRCKEWGLSWPSIWQLVLPKFEEKHGPHTTWITPELREMFDEKFLEAEEERAVQELQRIREKRRLKSER